MKDLTYLFSSFEGRLSRRAFWSACSAMVLAELVLAAVLARATGLGWIDFIQPDRRATWITLVVVAFFFWPSLALCMKRLHDRDLPGWWAGLLHVLVFTFYADQVGLRPLIRDKAAFFIAMLPAILLFVVGAWMLVELAMLKGTSGDNQFGPAPKDDRTPLRTPPAPAPNPGE